MVDLTGFNVWTLAGVSVFLLVGLVVGLIIWYRIIKGLFGKDKTKWFLIGGAYVLLMIFSLYIPAIILGLFILFYKGGKK